MGLHPYHGRGRGFNSHLLHLCGAVAQRSERVSRLIILVVAISFNMNLTDIQMALDLQQQALAFLLAARDSGRAASGPLDEVTVAAWKHADSCAEWVEKHYQELPAVNRPERREIPVFAQLLSSFFTTSFSTFSVPTFNKRGEDVTQVQIRALPQRRLDGTRKSNAVREREKTAARALRAYAFEALAEECGVDEARANFAAAETNASLSADLTLWTYAIQLVNRTQFASQGPAVYRLWLELPESTRKNLTAELVWRARQRLLEFLQSD